MNIFHLDKDPVTCAKYHLKFVPKDVEKHLNEDTTIIQRVKEF